MGSGCDSLFPCMYRQLDRQMKQQFRHYMSHAWGIIQKVHAACGCENMCSQTCLKQTVRGQMKCPLNTMTGGHLIQVNVLLKRISAIRKYWTLKDSLIEVTPTTSFPIFEDNIINPCLACGYYRKTSQSAWIPLKLTIDWSKVNVGQDHCINSAFCSKILAFHNKRKNNYHYSWFYILCNKRKSKGTKLCG